MKAYESYMLHRCPYFFIPKHRISAHQGVQTKPQYGIALAIRSFAKQSATTNIEVGAKLSSMSNIAMLFRNCISIYQRECYQDAVKDCLAGADWRGVRGDDHATGTASDWPKEYRVGTCWKPWIPWVEQIENATQKWFKHIQTVPVPRTSLMTAIMAYQ